MQQKRKVDQNWHQPTSIDWSKRTTSDQTKSPQFERYSRQSNKNRNTNKTINNNNNTMNSSQDRNFDIGSRYTRNIEIPINQSNFKLSTGNGIKSSSSHETSNNNDSSKNKKSYSHSMNDFNLDLNNKLKRNNYVGTSHSSRTNSNSNSNSSSHSNSNSHSNRNSNVNDYNKSSYDHSSLNLFKPEKHSSSSSNTHNSRAIISNDNMHHPSTSNLRSHSQFHASNGKNNNNNDNNNRSSSTINNGHGNIRNGNNNNNNNNTNSNNSINNSNRNVNKQFQPSAYQKSKDKGNENERKIGTSITTNTRKYNSISSLSSHDNDISMTTVSSINSNLNLNKQHNKHNKHNKVSNRNFGNELIKYGMGKKRFNKYDQSVIRPTDRVVLYSPFTHCYVCIKNDSFENHNNSSAFSFFDSGNFGSTDDTNIGNNNNNNSNNQNGMSLKSNESISSSYSHKTMLLSHNSLNNGNSNNSNNNNNNNGSGLNGKKIGGGGLYLECNDMEGTPLRIGETQFAGTCRFLTDCKIQLITGQGLSKDRNKITVSMQATKFMLENTNDIEHKNTASIHVGNKVFIFVEASKRNSKQFWSVDTKDNNTIILKECHRPGIRETFILQKFGQPLTLEENEIMIEDGEIVDNFLDDAPLHVQEYYLCKDILNVLSKEGFSGDFIQVMSKYDAQNSNKDSDNNNNSSSNNKSSSSAVYSNQRDKYRASGGNTLTDDMPVIIFNFDQYGIETVLSSAVKQLLPLMEHTQQVRYFVKIHEKCEYGIVSQALCFEMKRHLKDFNALLVQLESRLNKQELTLQNLKFYLQRATRTMQALRQLSIQIHSQYGINNNKNGSFGLSNNNNNSNNKFTHLSTFSFVTNDTNSSFSGGLNSSRSSLATVSSLGSKTHSQIIRKTGHYSTSIENISRLPMNAKGGGLLNILQRAMDTSGEKHVRLLYTQLMKAACIPYFDMLANWIYKGVINDIYDEFMIREKAHLKKEDIAQEYNNEYWTSRYSINEQQIPSLLFDYQDMIVTTGKYLNVMRNSGCPIQPLSFDGIIPNHNNNNNNSNNGNRNNSATTGKENMSFLSNGGNTTSNLFSNGNDLTRFQHSLHKCHPRDLGHYIREAYHFASKALLDMLLKRERIMDRFRSIQRYMLLSEGDWFEYFIDMSESILNQNAADIKIVKLNRLLELSIRTSVSKNDIFKDNVCCDIKNKDLNTTLAKLHDLKNDFMINKNNSTNIPTASSTGTTATATTTSILNRTNNTSLHAKGLMSLSGMQAFALDYKVEWPASIIFTGRNVTRYQLIFRLLFKLKIVERQLKIAWKQQMCLRQFNLKTFHNKSLLLRQKMLQFIESLLFYIFYEVIEPNWCQFILKISKSNTVDALLQLQDDFLRTTMHMCLLTDNKQVESLFSVLSACEGYATYISRYTADWKINFEIKSSERKTVIQMVSKDFRDNLTTKKFQSTIDEYSNNFEISVKDFLNDLHQSSTMNMNTLLSRLDFNAYYMPKILF